MSAVTAVGVHGGGADVETLLPLLAAWLPEQRWFGGKDAPVDGVRLLARTRLRERNPAVDHLVLAVDQGTRSDAYQVLVSTGGTRGHERPVDDLGTARIGEVDGATVVDGLHDPVATALLLGHLRAGTTVGDLVFLPEPDALPRDRDLPATVLTAEQSNTSLVYGGVALFKVFRRLQVGTNPDIEVHRALTHEHTPGVAALLGAVEGSWADPVTGVEVRGSLAMCQAFLDLAVDGWVRATTSARDAATGGDDEPRRHARGAGPASRFGREARELGTATARIHAAMAGALPHGSWGPAEVAGLSRVMHDRLDAALARVPALRPYAAGLRRAFDAVSTVDTPVPVQRIHGDLHLGQALHTQAGWVIVDFEGEPATTLAERVALQPAVRDVAGMLRSFDYAARHQLGGLTDADTRLVAAVERWAADNRAAFCLGYAEVSGRDPREQEDLLRAYECDKAVYEAVYEANNRPSWLPIPMAAVARLVADA